MAKAPLPPSNITPYKLSPAEEAEARAAIQALSAELPERFGLMVATQDMAPRYKSGDTIYAAFDSSVKPGKDHVFCTSRTKGGEGRVARLEKVTRAYWHVRRPGAGKSAYKLKRSEWPLAAGIYRVHRGNDAHA